MVGDIINIANEIRRVASGPSIISACCALPFVWGEYSLKKLSFKHYISIALAFIGIIIPRIYDV